jgi:hypothetical protein
MFALKQDPSQAQKPFLGPSMTPTRGPVRRTVVTRVYEAVRAIALCHNVTPVYEDDDDVNSDDTEADRQSRQTVVYQASSPDEVNSFYTPRSPKGEGGILFYLCPSFRPSKIFFVAFFSVTVDGRNLIFGHKLHIGIPYCGKRFWTHQIHTSCLSILLIFIHI